MHATSHAVNESMKQDSAIYLKSVEGMTSVPGEKAAQFLTRQPLSWGDFAKNLKPWIEVFGTEKIHIVDGYNLG